VASRHNADIADTLQLKATMVTTFWLPMVCNFSCMIASNTLFDSRVGFSGSNYPMKIQLIDGQKDVALATDSVTKIAITGFV